MAGAHTAQYVAGVRCFAADTAGGIELIPFGAMAMTLRLTDEEQEALRQRAELEGISMQEAARRAVREFVDRSNHRDRVATAAARILDVHADALRRLGE